CDAWHRPHTRFMGPRACKSAIRGRRALEPGEEPWSNSAVTKRRLASSTRRRRRRQTRPLVRSLALATGIATACMGTTAWAAPTPGNKIKGKGGNIGVGVSLGDPMGGSAKFFLHPNHALQLDL